MSSSPALPVAAAAVAVRGLAKTYRANGRREPHQALKGIDLTIPRGSLFGLLGPNGAGKSTLINILAGLVSKTAGQASIWGIDIDQDPRQARAAIGVVTQELIMDPFFSPRELLQFQAGLYGVPARERCTEELLAAVGLSDQADAYARTLSGGMRRRLMVAKALVHRPPVLVLDEPTAGVDVELRRQLWDYVRFLHRNGTTILLTTHYLEEAQELCDTIAIINHGELVACEPKEQLLHRIDCKELTLVLDRDLAAVPAGLAAFQGQLTVELVEPRRLVLRYRRQGLAIEALLAAVRAEGVGLVDLTTKESDLEDVFLQLTRAPEGADAA